MSEQTITVTGMTCEHCAGAVREEIAELPGVRTVDVRLDDGAVTVTSEAPLAADQLAAAVDEAGYAIA